MKKSVFPTFLRSVLILGLKALLVGASCSSRMQTKSTENAITVNHSTPDERSNQAVTKSEILQARDADPETVETRLTELFGLCQSGDMDEAAAYFVYRGVDKSREWKDIFHASDPAEKAEVGEVCQRIKGYLDESQEYQFGAVKVERESEGEWHALEVSFQQGDKTKKVIFAFLPIKGQFAIGDIDG